ncbi:MAG: hypothetical protein R3C58_00500 [Parvularculaceae bacterium]
MNSRTLVEANFLAANGASQAPGAKALATAQDRLYEKQFVNSIGAKTAAFHPVDDLAAPESGP